MATLAQQVKDLQKQNKELSEVINRQNQRINELQKDIEDSDMYKQAISDIHMLQEQLDQAREEISRLEAEKADMFEKYSSITEQIKSAAGHRTGRPPVYSEDLRLEIRQKRSEGMTIRAIAQEYQMGLATVHVICEGIAAPPRRKMKRG